jgi:hypothetical protein
MCLFKYMCTDTGLYPLLSCTYIYYQVNYVCILCVRVIYTGRFIMFFVATNKKTKGPTLMELFTATGKQNKGIFLQLGMFDVCTTGDTAHIDTIFKFLPQTWVHGYSYTYSHHLAAEM